MKSRQNHIHVLLWITTTLLLCNDVICIQYTPIDMEQYSECAVIVTSPREEFSHSHSLRSDFDGAVNCITYDAINQAYLDAMKRIGASPVEDIPPPPEIADIALVLLEVTQQLAKQYNLNQEDVELGLAQVDTLKTAIREICPAYLYSITCHAGKYRRHDGICTNIEHPSWGATNTVFTRLIPPQFSDLVSSPRVSLSGAPLPPARIVSRTIHEDIGFHDHAGTTMLIAWGQFMDHDLTLMGMPLDPINRNEVRSCCDTPPSQQNPYCFEIEIPRDDYFYRKFNIRCQDFVRSFPGVRPDCKLGPRNPFNTLTAAIDGNTVYGVNAVLARQLRTLQGGLLKMNPAFTELNLKDLLPPKVDIPDEGCVRTNFTQFCFLAGEIRVNEQLILSCIHTLMAREHNRIARELSAINPHWEDEIVYEETRRIVIAEIQHITFNELLPIVLGKHTMEKYGLLLNPKGYWDGYDPETNIGILDAFAAAAFRFGHSLLPTSVERWSKVHKFIASRRLSNLIRQPFDLYRAGVIDEYILGLTNQAAQAMDDSVTQEVTNNLFKRAGNRFGLDLIAFNIQRGREFGLPGYMFYRERCGLRTSFTFDEMIGTMPNLTIQRYSTIYESPWDIDLWSAGAAELPMHGSLVGPTFACIIANQFKLARHGDRFWYELPNQPSSFTEDQLREIKKIRLSRIICDNTDLVETIQIYAMVLPDLSINPRVSCKSSVLPSIDLSHWRDGPEAEEVFADPSNNQTTYNKVDIPSTVSNQTSGQPSAYEYHIKTVAIIGDSSQLMNLTDILNRSLGENLSYENNEIDHLSRPRRSTNETAAASNIFMTNITAPKSKDITPSSSSNRLHNVTSSSSNTSSSTGATKDLTKRSFYPGHSLNHGRARTQQPEMTQAIMEENPNPSEDYPAYHRRSSIGGHFTSAAAEDDEQHDIEDFFRKNVPIYDGVPIARRGYQGSSSAAVSPKKYYHFSPSPLAADGEEEEEEEDGGFGGGGGKPMKGLLEVDHDEDMDHEYVPMKVNHLGKQIVMEDEVAQDEEADDQPLYPYYPAKNYHHHTDDDDSGFYSSKPGAPSSHPYPFENSYSSAFKSSSPYHYHHQSDYPSSPSFSSGSSSPFSSAGSPSKYGTSHQYNSLADQQPRYYKHFKPSIPYPAHDDDDRPAAPSYSSYSSPTRLSSYPTPPTRSTYYNNHDFVPKRAPSGGGGGIRGAYASKYPTRSTHVPQTLEEYHRLHGTFDTRKKNANPRPYSRPIIVPQDDNHKEEDEEEEKDKDTADYTSSRGPKSFVSLNFGTTGTSAESDDEGVSVRHEIGHHFKPRKPYFRPALPENTDADDEEEPQHQEYQVEYPSESISGSTKYRGSGGDDDDDETSPGAIKNFVESVFKQNKNYDPDIVVGKKSHLVSPYNPHFGERVKQKTPEQNLLWHRKSSDARVARDKQSRDKNDRLLHEENIKMYDSLVKEVTMKPAKRDADTDDRSQEDEDEQKTSSTLATPVPQETQTKPTEVEPEDDKPQFKYWSKTSSEPN